VLQHQQEDPLHVWVSRIKYRNIPVFSQTVQEIAQLTASDRSSAFDLAHVVLRDPALAARVLHAANSFTLNPHGYPINSVSRAVIMLGFNTVRRVSLSVALIDAFLRGPHQHRILEELARCFHAATQSWALARHFADHDPEEVFVAALLHSIGEIAFWISGDATAFDLDAALSKPGAQKVQTEEEILGFRLRQLTARLNREWQVSGLLDTSLSDNEENKRAGYIRGGHRIAVGAQKGWNHPAVATLIDDMANRLELKAPTLMAMAHEAAREAARLASSYDAATIAELIPQPV
jgi:HD-like signal output (HDOD) protein